MRPQKLFPLSVRIDESRPFRATALWSEPKAVSSWLAWQPFFHGKLIVSSFVGSLDFKILILIFRGVVHSKKSSYTPQKKSEKNPKKIFGFFRGFEIRIPYLGVNNSSNSVFKSFFIYKILVHQKKISKIPQKLKDFFGEFKIRTPFLGVNIPSWNSINLMP